MTTKTTIGAVLLLVLAAVVGLLPLSPVFGAGLVLVAGLFLFVGLRWIALSEAAEGVDHDR